jgi:hypothetical protein
MPGPTAGENAEVLRAAMAAVTMPHPTIPAGTAGRAVIINRLVLPRRDPMAAHTIALITGPVTLNPTVVPRIAPTTHARITADIMRDPFAWVSPLTMCSFRPSSVIRGFC